MNKVKFILNKRKADLHVRLARLENQNATEPEKNKKIDQMGVEHAERGFRT